MTPAPDASTDGPARGAAPVGLGGRGRLAAAGLTPAEVREGEPEPALDVPAGQAAPVPAGLAPARGPRPARPGLVRPGLIGCAPTLPPGRALVPAAREAP